MHGDLEPFAVSAPCRNMISFVRGRLIWLSWHKPGVRQNESQPETIVNLRRRYGLPCGGLDGGCLADDDNFDVARVVAFFLDAVGDFAAQLQGF